MSVGVLSYRAQRYSAMQTMGGLLLASAKRLITGMFNHRACQNNQTPAEKLRTIVTDELTATKVENHAFTNSPLGAAKILNVLIDKLRERRQQISANSYVNGDQRYGLIEQLLLNDMKAINDCLSSCCYRTCQAMLEGIDTYGSAYDYLRNKSTMAAPVQGFEKS